MAARSSSRTDFPSPTSWRCMDSISAADPSMSVSTDAISQCAVVTEPSGPPSAKPWWSPPKMAHFNLRTEKHYPRMMKSTPKLMSASWAAWLGEGALASLLLAMAGNLAPCACEVHITDFGAKPDSRRNAVAAVQRALEACRKADYPILVFPPGRYD